MRQLTIDRLGAQGDGVTEDGAIFVARALPGERVEGEVVEGRIAAPRILTPPAARIKPICAHYNACGGCAVQHANDSLVADWKRALVRTALARCGLRGEVCAPLSSPIAARRRVKIAARRTKAGALAGFHGRRSETIVDVRHCAILDPRLAPAFDIARHLAKLGASRSTALALLATASEDGLDIAVTGGKELGAEMQVQLGAYCDQMKIARLAWSGEVMLQRHPPRQRLGPAYVVPPPGAFLQATQAAQVQLQTAVLEIAQGAGNALDLFAGCGTFSFALAESAAVHAVEGAQDMVQALEAAARNTSGLKAVTAETRDLFRRPLLPEELKPYQLVVLDPPRAGARAQVAQLAASAVSRIAYVSCNPVSFAQDASVLVQAGFEMGPVQPIDQFRWSPHVELVAAFTRA